MQNIMVKTVSHCAETDIVKITKIVIPNMEDAGRDVFWDGLERPVLRKLKKVCSISETIL